MGLSFNQGEILIGPIITIHNIKDADRLVKIACILELFVFVYREIKAEIKQVNEDDVTEHVDWFFGRASYVIVLCSTFFL